MSIHAGILLWWSFLLLSTEEAAGWCSHSRFCLLYALSTVQLHFGPKAIKSYFDKVQHQNKIMRQIWGFKNWWGDCRWRKGCWWEKKRFFLCFTLRCCWDVEVDVDVQSNWADLTNRQDEDYQEDLFCFFIIITKICSTCCNIFTNQEELVIF